MIASVKMALMAASSAKANAPRGIAPPTTSQTAGHHKGRLVSQLAWSREHAGLTPDRGLGFLVDVVEVLRKRKGAVPGEGECLSGSGQKETRSHHDLRNTHE